MAGTDHFFSSVVDYHWGLDNFAEKASICYNDQLLIEGYQSIQGVDNYLNIPYARITARFCIAEMEGLEKFRGKLDATRYGPRAPQAQGADKTRYLCEHMVEKLGNTQRMSEMDCLNINIYTPPISIGDGPFPILCYIHGGGFVAGDSLTEFGRLSQFLRGKL